MNKVFITLLFSCLVLALSAQPVILAYGPLEFCSGDSVTLCTESLYPSYLWNTGNTTMCITVMQSGEYWVAVQDDLGNIDTAWVTVLVHLPEPLVTVLNDTLYVLDESLYFSYQWFFMELPLVGAVGQQLPVQEGTYAECYWMQVIDENGCTGQSGWPGLDYDCVFSVEVDEQVASGLRLYPNPAHEYFFIETDQESVGTLRLQDIAGRQVLSVPLHASRQSINVEDILAGVYVAVVEQQGAVVGRRKVIVE